MMDISCNYRGLGNPQAVRSLCNLLQREDPSFVFIIEIKLYIGEMEIFKYKTGYHNGLAVDCCNKGEGLCMLWREDVGIIVRSFSKFHIDVNVGNTTSSSQWRLTAFYGHSKASKRVESWNLLRQLS